MRKTGVIGCLFERVIFRIRYGWIEGDRLYIEKYAEDANSLLKTQEFSAAKWADAFAKFNPNVDRGMMVAWFACAIMTGYDVGYAKNKRPITTPIFITRN